MILAEIIFNYAKKSYNISVIGDNLLDVAETKGRIHVLFEWQNDKGEHFATKYILSKDQFAQVKHIIEVRQEELATVQSNG